jgi:hypothetical protein
MAAFGAIAKVGAPILGGLLGGLLAGGSKPKTVSQPAPLPTINNADALAASQRDAIRRRRGAGANELTGGGAEAVTPGGKALLGQ